MNIRRFSRAAACPTNSASDFGRSAASASSGVRMGVVRATGSVIMVYCLAGDRNPRLLALLIDRIVGDETVSRLEIAERNRIGVMVRSEEHTSELQSLMRISYAVFCLKKKN